MAYLVPYHIILDPSDSVVSNRGFIFQQEDHIPDGEYELAEWYCPNVDCDCREVVFSVIARHLRRAVVWIRYSFDPNKQQTNPFLSPGSDQAPYAEALLKIIAQNLKNDPAFTARLKLHYHQLKKIAADSSHPAHHAVVEWGRTGKSMVDRSQPKRKL